MEACTACGQSLEELDALKVGAMLTRHMTMYRWSSKQAGQKEIVPGLGEVEVVYNSYDFSGGEEGSQAFVWNTRAGHIKVTGSYDSYCDLDWYMDYKFVSPKTKEVVYFE
jgi:hypothetical protein